ncbi:hypothetical protein ACL9RI_27145 [Janthinobacterium sp. Mn2066]|uniref:hypothetical protein n=1 Tax=Janthinobacterium sp. Mn2066 TaxID=3395264 RepID=UPI003BDCCEAB
MTSEEMLLLERRKKNFAQFYEELSAALVDFIGRLGIQPSHAVLTHAPQFAHHVSQATQDFQVESEGDRTWLAARMSYYIGEYFVQKYSGCWYVNDIPDSRYFARFVVGKFNIADRGELMVDPFQVADAYIAEPPPRALGKLLAEVEQGLLHLR